MILSLLGFAQPAVWNASALGKKETGVSNCQTLEWYFWGGNPEIAKPPPTKILRKQVKQVHFLTSPNSLEITS